MTPAQIAFEKRKARLAKEKLKKKEGGEVREGVWSVLVEYDGGVGSDTYVFKTKAEADKWHEAAVKCREREDVYHVTFIPFRTFEESMEKFCASHDRDTDDEGEGEEGEDYECEECGTEVVAADIPEDESWCLAYGSLSMAFCKACYERSWAEHPDNPVNKESEGED